MTKPLQLIITCDDGGLSAGIDTSVIELYERGLVSGVSVMSNMPYAKLALQRYRVIPSLEIGAHLTLTEGQVITTRARQSSLVNNSTFKSRTSLMMRGLFLSIDLLEIIHAELDAQMCVFIEHGIQPAHITTHHHFHMLPKLRRIIYDLAEKYRVKWVRNSTLRGVIMPNNPFIGKVSPKQNKRAFIEPDYIVLVMEWMKHSPRAMLRQLERLDGLIEIVFHPSLAVDETFPEDILYQPQERHRENIFMDKFFEIAQHKIEVIQIT